MAVTVWQTVLDIDPNGIVILDAEGIITAVNQNAQLLLGELLIGQRWIDIITYAFTPKVDDGHEISLRNGRKVSIMIRNLQNDPGQLIALTDLTETAVLQESFNRKQRLAEMGEMTAHFAHQIRTPVATAMLYANLVGSAKVSDEKRLQYSEKMQESLHAIENQIKDMLLYAKGDRPEPNISDVDVGNLFSEVIQRMAGTLEKHQCTVSVENNNATALIRCDAEAMFNALQNLLENAIHASKWGSAITLYCIENESSFDLGVRDQGCGIKSELFQKITQPFYTTKSEGTGLGLSVVQAVANAHDGELIIESNEGVGTNIYLKMPIDAIRSKKEKLHERFECTHC